jgi:hypothetical protein
MSILHRWKIRKRWIVTQWLFHLHVNFTINPLLISYHLYPFTLFFRM